MLKTTCKELIKGGLLLKRVQAKLLLNHSSSRHWDIREALQELKGNQGCFKRQDPAGGARATEIKRLQAKRSNLRRSSANSSAEAAKGARDLTEQIETLKLEHQHKNLVREVQSLLNRWEELHSGLGDV